MAGAECVKTNGKIKKGLYSSRIYSTLSEERQGYGPGDMAARRQALPDRFFIGDASVSRTTMPKHSESEGNLCILCWIIMIRLSTICQLI